MSDIRFNQWLHNSGTGGVSQVDGGHVGIGTTNPLIPVGAGVTAVLNVGVVTANSYYGSGANLTGIVGSATSLSFNDNIGAYWGNAQDLKIHHDGNHSYIDDQGTGNLRLRSGTLEITNLASNKTSALFSSGGGQTLNFNNSAKFVTTNTGIDVTGSVVADDLIVTGTSVVGDFKSTNNNYVLGIAGNNASDKSYVGTDSSGNFLIATGSGVDERLRITSGGQVQIKETAGTSGDGASLKFHFANNNSTDVISSIYFANNIGNVASIKGQTRNGNNYGMISFHNQVNGSDGESMRLNHDGGFCVGTDSTRTAEFTQPDGFSVRSRDAAKGQFQVSVTNETCALLNKKGNNGQIIGFRKDGTGVGEIGVNASTMYLNFGGTVAAAHQLDDYEEGSFTATLGGSGWTYSNQHGFYRKVGTIVHVSIWIQASGGPNNGASLLINLPFTSYSSSVYRGGISASFNSADFDNGFTEGRNRSHIDANVSYMQASFPFNDNGNWSSTGLTNAGVYDGFSVQASGTYISNS